MSIISDINDIESKYSTEEILYNDVGLWPYIRLYMSYAIFGKGKIESNSSNIISAIKNLFYGFFNIFKKVDYIFFTDTADRKLINDKYYDRIDFLSDKYNNKLVFELTTTKFYSRKNIPTQNITSKIPLYLISKIIKLFINTKNVKGNKIIEQIKKENEIDINIDSLLKDYIAQYIVAKILIKVYKPKAFILAPSYTNMPYIAAFKEKNIKIIEFQHGIIIKSHLAYNFKKPTDKLLFPDYLLSYGEFEKTIFNANNNFINSEKVIPIGHFYINYIYSNFKYDTNFQQKTQKYKYKIAVSLQDTFDTKMMDFINKLAKINTDVAFVLIPRTSMNIKPEYDNTIIYSNLNCYETVLNCDYHCTIYSSCAIESLGLHKPNILINIDGKSEEHLGFLLEDKTNNILINSIDDFNNFMQNIEHKEYASSTQKYFMNNFSENLNLTFDKILEN